MELDNLRSTWRNIDSKSNLDVKLRQEEIGMLLQKRSSGRIQKIDRNIKIGFGLILMFLSIDTILQYIEPTTLSPKLEGIKIPKSVVITGVLVDTLLLSIFSFFVYKYRKLRIKQISSSALPKAISSLIESLHTFKKQFFLGLIVLTINWAYSFIIGFNKGLIIGRDRGFEPDTINNDWIIILTGIIVMILFITPLVLLFRWGFNKLYGQYLSQFKSILEELKETN